MSDDSKPQKEIPMLFSTDMVSALLNGSKTETRRDKNLKVVNEYPYDWVIQSNEYDGKNLKLHVYNIIDKTIKIIKCPYGKPGDLIWVKETFCWINNEKLGEESYYDYKADTGDKYPGDWPSDMKPEDVPCKWKSSIFMPKAAARIWLEITDITLQRLFDITEESALNEGIERLKHEFDGFFFKDYLRKPDIKSGEIMKLFIDPMTATKPYGKR